jgi:hypothetical protein
MTTPQPLPLGPSLTQQQPSQADTIIMAAQPPLPLGPAPAMPSATASTWDRDDCGTSATSAIMPSISDAATQSTGPPGDGGAAAIRCSTMQALRQRLDQYGL